MIPPALPAPSPAAITPAVAVIRSVAIAIPVSPWPIINRWTGDIARTIDRRSHIFDNVAPRSAWRRPTRHAEILGESETILVVHRGLAPSIGALADFDRSALRNQGQNLAVQTRRFTQIGIGGESDRLCHRANRRQKGDDGGRCRDPYKAHGCPRFPSMSHAACPAAFNSSRGPAFKLPDSKNPLR